jgi:signal transduction histidine kinase
MNYKLTEVSSLDFYNNKATLKILVFVISIFIGFASIYYTNIIVENLKEREQNLIDLYANTIEYTANENNKDNLTFLHQEIIVPNNSIPVILTDGNGNVSHSRNINLPSSFSEDRKNRILQQELAIMKTEHEPIEIILRNEEGEIYDYNYVYYRNSHLLNQLKYYPYVQLSIIAVFGILAYIAFNYSKTAEQNRVWVGLAKETAHQLGTPLSSLMAWIEYFKADPDMKNQEVVTELEKDVHKLEIITSRFSNIGSIPVLKEENIYEVVSGAISYLEKRISTKVKISLETTSKNVFAKINKPLFDWVIENLCKNAVDAMSGIGTLDIKLTKANGGKIFIDITDNGKGMNKSKVKQVFRPGFTTKKRGWGLGLTLAKRIIENYHKGKIFVKSSEVDVGTTFRIVLFNSLK